MSLHRKVLTLSLLLPLLTACGGKKVATEKIIDAVVGVMCKRIITCQPEVMPSEDACKSSMGAALKANKEKTEKVSASQKELDACVSSIEKTECEKLFGAEPPQGCEFLK